MILATTGQIPGKEFEVLGLVIGNFVNSKNMFSDLGQGFKSMIGGELKAYTEMMAKTRSKATARMVEEAEKLGADAVIGVRYVSSEILAGCSEITAYGTAVRFN